MKTKRIITIMAALACLIFTAGLVQAQVPQIIDFHGQLTGTDAAFDGTGQFKFALVSSGGTTTYWSNDLTSTAGSQPTSAVTLPVNSGLYAVGLGNTALANMKLVPYNVFNNNPVFVRVWFNDGVNGWQQLTPDTRIGSAGYAFMADKVSFGAVGSTQLAASLTLAGSTTLTGDLNLPATTSATVGVLNIGGSPFLHDLGPTNTFLGASSGNFTMSGTYNAAIGESAEPAMAAGSFNTALGDFALYDDTAGSSNIALGFESGFYTTGSDNIDIDNYGVTGESETIRIGTNQTQTFLVGETVINGGLTVDQAQLNTGNLAANAITFGVGSGEGIASDRTNAGISPYDVEFWTDYVDRLEIQNNGNVGIGTATPTQKLEVNGEYLMVDGLGGVQVYIGDDGSGNDVQIGSLKSGVTNVACFNATDNKYMRLYCSSIEIVGGSDLAEPFTISKAKHPVAAGNVVVIDDRNPGHLTLTNRPYDTRVAGVVSGANGIHPGIQMRQDGLLDGDQNVALTGRVYVQADASNGAIEPGDMLTTSDTPGVAMKVTDHVRAQGAILGKAMSSLKEGHGMVLVLVTLQ